MPGLRALAAAVAGGLMLAAAGAGAAQEWEVAEGARAWSFPRDHGSHPAFRTEWWYWNATRAIPPAEGEAGPINEMPFFTFLFGDLHAHMMALPYTLLALGLALNLIRDTSRPSGRVKDWLRDTPEWLTLALLEPVYKLIKYLFGYQWKVA